MSKEIQLTKGYVAVVDDEDYDWLMQWKWQYVGGYARRTARHEITGKEIGIIMHRAIMALRDDDYRKVDHKDWNGLNNQKSNLRVCTNAQNLQWSRKRRGCSSQYKGVLWDKRNKKWRAKIWTGERVLSLGMYHDEQQAAIAYDKAAKELRGEFAALNFPQR